MKKFLRKISLLFSPTYNLGDCFDMEFDEVITYVVENKGIIGEDRETIEKKYAPMDISNII